jgi:hypothetical protein
MAEELVRGTVSRGHKVSEAARRWDNALARMARLAPQGADRGNVAGTLERVCMAAVELLAASGTGISLMADHGNRGFAAASDPPSRDLEELQFTLGEGPCIEAFNTGRPILVPDLSDGQRRRWPMYATAAQERGVRAVFAFPIQIGASRVGVLDVFRNQPGPMTAEQIGQAVIFADIALMTVLDGQQNATVGGVPRGFDQAPGFRAEIAQAQGMIMVQLGVSIVEALVRLRAYAYAEGRLVGDVALDVVAGRINFTEVAP